MSKVENYLKNKPVFVIDDSEIARQSLKLLFEGAGATVYTSGNIEKVTTVLRGLIESNQVPALILIDVKLPGCFGMRALYVLQEVLMSIQVPIIVMSSGFNQFAIEKMKLYGVVGFASKPTRIDHLYKFTLQVLESQLSIVSELPVEPVRSLQKAG